MKTALNAKELRDLDACEDGYGTFFAAHSDKTVTLSQALDSNGWDDIWWYISEAHTSFSKVQVKDLRILACDYAEDTLYIFEEKHPNDRRPRLAIDIARKFANNDASSEDLSAAWAAAWDASSAAWVSAGDAAGAAMAARAARAARAAAGDVAWASVRDAAGDAARAVRASARAVRASAGDVKRKWQTEKLRELFVKWESEQ